LNSRYDSVEALLQSRQPERAVYCILDKPGEETKAKPEELKFLVSSIGPTGLLALKPFLRMSRKDFWQLYMLSN
jgi:hypothetical protein